VLSSQCLLELYHYYETVHICIKLYHAENVKKHKLQLPVIYRSTGIMIIIITLTHILS